MMNGWMPSMRPCLSDRGGGMKAEISAADVRQARENAGLTLKKAAEIAGVELRSWQRYEASERKIPRPTWELFLIKTKQKI